MRYDSPQGQVVVDALVTPTDMALDPESGQLYVTEFATGNVILVDPE